MPDHDDVCITVDPSFVALYDEVIGAERAGLALSALGRLVLDRLEPGARVLDLACGAGHVTAGLVEAGFEVVGVDLSAPMIERARANAPGADLRVADARSFELERPVRAVVSTFDSVNHVLRLDDVRAVFGRVHDALEPSGVFVFDVYSEADFRPPPLPVMAEIEPDRVVVHRGRYDRAERLATAEVTLFTPAAEAGLWRRADQTFVERLYTREELETALADAGFADVEVFHSETDLGHREPVVREYYRARRK